MVDIMDMEDIIREILKKNPYFADLEIADHVVEFYLKKIMLEVSDFVEGQQTIKCNNCDRIPEESFSETRRMMMEDYD